MEKAVTLSDITTENIYHCIKCGLCLAHCPVYKEILLEDASPRGKVQIAKWINEGNLDLSEEVKQTLFSTCLLCGSCVANCPSGVHGTHLFSGLRWRAIQRYGIAWKKKVLFQILSRRWMISPSAWFARWAQKAFDDLRLQVGALPAHAIPRLNEVPFSRTVPERVAPVGGTERASILYFHGCATNYLYGDIGRAVVRSLTHMGVAVRIPRDQICCGLPIFLSGDRAASFTSIRRTLALFAAADADAVIVDCATCGSALKNEYPHLLREMRELGDPVTEDDIDAADRLAAKVRDITVFIAEHEDWLPQLHAIDPPCRVTYHDPCHLAKGQKVSAEPRQLLRAIPGVEFVEMAGADDCCGGGGSFQIEYADTSAKITNRKIANIAKTRADILATGCPGCNLTIGAHLEGTDRPTVVHPVQILARAL